MSASPNHSPGRRSFAAGFDAWGRNTFAALAIPNYRNFFIGQGISLVGTWMRRTAMGWYTFQLTGSYKLLGVVMAAALFPMFILAPIAGAIADRVEKRWLIIWSQIFAAFFSAILALLVWSEWAGVGSLVVLALLTGAAFSFEVPARQAYVFEMVGRDHLMNAIALNSALVNLSRIIGPAVAGILMGWFGASLVFAGDAASYLVVIATLLAIDVRGVPMGVRKGSRLQHLAEGWVEVIRNKRVLYTLSLLFLVTSCGWSFNTLLPAIAQDTMKLSETRYGILMSMFGLGAIGGALFVAGRGEKSRPRAQMYIGIIIMIIGVSALSFTRHFETMAPTLVVAGFGGIMFLSTANTVIQTSVSDEIRGRVMGIWSLVFGGALPLGTLLAGIVAESISPFLTIQLFLVACVIGCAGIYLRAQKVRKRNGGELGPPAAAIPQEQT